MNHGFADHFANNQLKECNHMDNNNYILYPISPSSLQCIYAVLLKIYLRHPGIPV